MPTAKVTSKGQITIPLEVRAALGLKPGARVMIFRDANGNFVLRPQTGSIMDLEGCLAGYDVPKTDEELNELIHRRAAQLDAATKSDARRQSDGEVA